jgi:hypothetical protein
MKLFRKKNMNIISAGFAYKKDVGKISWFLDFINVSYFSYILVKG